MIGHGPPLRPGAAVGEPRMAVVGVVRGKQANVVPLADQLVREGFDMPFDAAGIRVRVR